MKPVAIRKLRCQLAADQPAVGLWVTLESPSLTEIGVALGMDWIVIDAEHGHLDWKEIVEHIRAAVRSDTVILVRLAECSSGLIKRALDLGADGVMIPFVESADQLRQVVEFAHFPPEGKRGMGAERASGWGECLAQHADEANEHVLIVPVIESVAGGQNIQALLDVPGVDLFFLGPADYSSTAGHRGQWEGPGVADQLLQIKDAIRAAGKHCGVFGTSDENLRERESQGFRMLGVGSDTSLILRSLHKSLASMGRDRALRLELKPVREAPPAVPPPLSVRAERSGAVARIDVEHVCTVEVKQ